MIANQVFQAIKSIKNVQVTIDHYQEDERIHREGFSFETLDIQQEKILFYKNNQLIKILDLHSYTAFQVLPDYENYFALYHGNNRIELYFE